jgi:hypothetical protein
LEALWVRDPQISGDVRAPHAPACLSKKRWDTLPFDGPCIDVTPDPRTADDVHQQLYCDQRPVRVGAGPNAWLSDPNILEVTKSAFIDAGLWRWRSLDGDEQRVTTKITTTEVPRDYRYRPDGTPPEPTFLGAVYAAPGSDGVRPSYAIPLYSYRHRTTGEYTTTTLGRPSTDYDEGVLEGYINAPSCLRATPRCPTSKPVYLYRKSNNDTFLTVPGVPMPGDATLVAHLGYLPR